MHSHTYVIEGGTPLKGEVTVGGSETLAVYLIAAAMLTQDTCIIKNVPRTHVVSSLVDCVTFLGVSAEFINRNTLSLNAQHITTRVIPANLAEKAEESALLIGPLVSRLGRASIAKSAESVLADLISVADGVTGDSNGFLTFHDVVVPEEYRFVDASPISNVAFLLSQIIGSGGSVLCKNIPITHELDELISVLTQMGANITRVEPGILSITRVEKLNRFETRLFGDSHEAVFWAIAAGSTDGDITIKGFETDHITSLYPKLTKLGIHYQLEGALLHVWRDTGVLNPISVVGQSHVGFLSRWAIWMIPLLAQSDGIAILDLPAGLLSVSFVDTLKKFGIEHKIDTDDTKGIVTIKLFGPARLHAAQIKANTSQEGCVLLLATLGATDTSTIMSEWDFDGCFDTLIEKMRSLGARL